DGRLVHSGGLGIRRLDGDVPDADTVFRIASMSKSFTASAVLLLRDAGRLALDDPAREYVPELAAWPGVTPDTAPVSLRNLLTMTAGFPTDDPWGDRQQGLSASDFGALLARGVSWNWAPGTRFEYSNLGYAILGRVVTAVSGTEYSEFVRTRLLAPLGMRRTGYTAEEFGGVSVAASSPAAPAPEGNLAQGYRRGPDGWEPVPFEPYGAFAPMGGVFSSVRDLATWVGGFASAFPPRPARPGRPGRPADPDRPARPVGQDGTAGSGEHPLSAASRREMQLPQAVTLWRGPERLPGGGPAIPAYYGLGLFVDEDPALGRIVNHSGGYPGFGSNMRWHPATGLGVIALANGTYAGTSGLTDQILRAIVARPAGRHVALAPAAPAAPGESAGKPAGAPWPETSAAQEAVNALLRSWDDQAADALFTENVALDAPYAERRYALDLLRSRIGEFRPDAGRPAESDTPAHRRWWLTGPGGTAQVQIQLSPPRPPRVQSLLFAIPPDPDGALAAVLSAVVTWMNGGSADWPPDVGTAPGTDMTLLSRRLRMAAAWAGKSRAGAFVSGDGSSFAGVELDGEHARLVLTLLVNPATGEIRSADVTL
ncbi:MAG: beta-lactamase family protein, partial [Nocardiopsaceae bacterium]|nr:beta-lactamase family protein [Nocardiopsaceae bacterium]